MPELVKPRKFKGQRFGPFRGSTPKGVVQTLDVGTGESERFLAKARGQRNRQYVSVDPGTLSYRMDNVEAVQDFVLEYLKNCIALRTRFRNINFDMPQPSVEAYDFNQVFDLLPKVLLPNGKVYITSEVPGFLEQLKKIADLKGFSSRLQPLLSEAAKKQIFERIRLGIKPELNGVPMTPFMEKMFNKGLYRLEVTYSLKQAFSNDRQRRGVWPH